MFQKRHNSGFTLVEMAVVVIIIGLIVGGIMGGRVLLKNSELRGVIAEAEMYSGAVKLFKDKYLSLPGDMPNATNIWGAAHATPATCITTVGVGTQTCNGDGNGAINATNEVYRAWQQLRNAGLIEGDFNGVQGPGGAADHLPGVNCPDSKLKGGGFSIWYQGATTAAATNFFPYYYNNIIMFGSKAAASYTHSPILSTEDAFSIDSKMDDGRPANGNVHTFKNTSPITPGCATSDVSTAAYNIAATGRLCNLIFFTGF